jgi:hypothetical protein
VKGDDGFAAVCSHQLLSGDRLLLGLLGAFEDVEDLQVAR